jgi:uncharacterized membrane protein YgaE (UPF0421/DUF939 family)
MPFEISPGEMGTVFVGVAVPVVVGLYIAVLTYSVHKLEKSVEQLEATIKKPTAKRKAAPKKKGTSRVSKK